MRQPNIQGVVVLCERVEAVVQHDVPERAVDVVGLGEAVAMGCTVDHAVLHLLVHTGGRKRGRKMSGEEEETFSFPFQMSYVSM